jgi:integration host factor subunit beta
MTRADLTEEVYQAIGRPLKESDIVVCAIFDSIVRALRSGEKVEIRGFGSFHTRQRRARIARNPKTGARVEVPPKRIPFFKPSKELRELVDSLNVNQKGLLDQKGLLGFAAPEGQGPENGPCAANTE